MASSDFDLIADRTATVMPALIAACPSFEQHEAYAAFTAGDSLPYLDIAAFARHLVDKLEQGETSEFLAVFSVVEALLLADEPGVAELVTAGLIEDLQNAAASRGRGLSSRFRPWLGPRTALAWDEVHRFWGTSDESDDIGCD
jgi:hypothetical protein